MGTIRLRLTLWYAALFLLAGLVLLALVYLLVGRAFPEDDPTFVDRVAERPGARHVVPTLSEYGLFAGIEGRPPHEGDPPSWQSGERPPPEDVGGRIDAVRTFVQEGREEAREQALHTLIVQSSFALLAMGVLSVGAGWVVAGRMLRPVADITGTVRRISGERLSEHRVALEGPRDELKELADQFDAMLDRLDEAFSAQREFVANASHELRTPLAVMRAELDVTFDDPNATAETMREGAEVIRRAISRSEALITALLTLERADAPRQRSEPVDLAERVTAVLDRYAERARERGIALRSTLDPAALLGDPVLIERMVDNLVANAIAYNQPPEGTPDGAPDGEAAGWIEVTTRRDSGDVVLRVANSAAPIDAETLDGLFERFRRADTGRSRETGGHGLGLAIVRAVARHHGGDASAEPVEDGLAFEVRIPAAPIPRGETESPEA